MNPEIKAARIAELRARIAEAEAGLAHLEAIRRERALLTGKPNIVAPAHVLLDTGEFEAFSACDMSE